jgi:tetratricopeptide (TPR) repeat protein
MEYGENASTIGVMKYLAHLQAFYLDKSNEAISILNKTIVIPNAQPSAIAECKIELADILLFTGDIWEAKLLYSQVDKAFKNDPVGHMAKFKNAKLSFYIGEFQWAKAQLDVLKAATSKLIANDALQLSVLISDNIDMDSSTLALSYYSRADLLLYRNKVELALLTLDSIFELADWHPIFDEVWYKKAEIEIKKKDYESAALCLTKIIEEYPYDITADNALFLLADLNENQFLNKEKALQLYERLLEDYPASVFTVEARKRFRILRGDFTEEGT